MVAFKNGKLNFEQYKVGVGFKIEYYLNGERKKETLYKAYDNLDEVEPKYKIYESLKKDILKKEWNNLNSYEKMKISFVPPKSNTMFLMITCIDSDSVKYGYEDCKVEEYYGKK